MKLKRSVDIEAVDGDRVRVTLAALIEQVRSLEVEDGMIVHPVSRRPIDRLRVVSGPHPRPGTVYAATRHLAELNVDPASPTADRRRDCSAAG